MGKLANRYENRNSQLLSIIVVVLLLVLSKQSWGYLIFYVMTLLMFMRIKLKLKLNIIKEYFVYFIVPGIIIFCHSIVAIVVYGGNYYFMRSLNNLIYSIVYVLFAYSLFIIHKQKAVNILCDGIIVYYFVLLMEAFFSVGPKTFVANIFIPGSDVLSEWLEAHDIGLSVGIVLLFYIFYEKNKSKADIRKIVFLSIIFLLCFKRIALFAAFVSAIFIILYRKRRNKKQRLILWWGIGGVIICMFFVYVIHEGTFTNWLWSHGINPMGRDNLYRYFKDYYDFSIFFWGRGSGFTSKLLTIGSVNGTGVGTLRALHSDILRAFIEYGYIGSILWYSYYLIFLPRHFQNRSEEIKQMLFAVAIYAFIIYLTDNASNYMLFQSFYILLPLCYARCCCGREKSVMHG